MAFDPSKDDFYKKYMSDYNKLSKEEKELISWVNPEIVCVQVTHKHAKTVAEVLKKSWLSY